MAVSNNDDLLLTCPFSFQCNDNNNVKYFMRKKSAFLEQFSYILILSYDLFFMMVYVFLTYMKWSPYVLYIIYRLLLCWGAFQERNVEDFYDKSRTVIVTISWRLYVLVSQRHVIRIIYYTEVCDDNDDHDSGQMGFDLMKFNLQKKIAESTQDMYVKNVVLLSMRVLLGCT